MLKRAGIPRALKESYGEAGGEYGKKRWAAHAMGHMIPTMMRPPGPISQALLGLEQPSRESVDRTIDQAKSLRQSARQIVVKKDFSNSVRNALNRGLESGNYTRAKGVFHEPRGPVREALGRVVREVQGKADLAKRVIKDPRRAAKGTWTGIKGNLQKALPGVFGKRAFIEGFLDEIEKMAAFNPVHRKGGPTLKGKPLTQLLPKKGYRLEREHMASLLQLARLERPRTAKDVLVRLRAKTEKMPEAERKTPTKGRKALADEIWKLRGKIRKLKGKPLFDPNRTRIGDAPEIPLERRQGSPPNKPEPKKEPTPAPAPQPAPAKKKMSKGMKALLIASAIGGLSLPPYVIYRLARKPSWEKEIEKHRSKD